MSSYFSDANAITRAVTNTLSVRRDAGGFLKRTTVRVASSDTADESVVSTSEEDDDIANAS